MIGGVSLPSADVWTVFSPVVAGLLIVAARDLYQRTLRYRRARARKFARSFVDGIRAMARALAVQNAPRWHEVAALERQRLAVEAAADIAPPRAVPGSPRRRVVLRRPQWPTSTEP